jgi:hypothetical protein
MNDRVLGSICDLGKYDGYIMNSQEARNGVGSFHSEVGLCKHAFNKLKLVTSVRAAPPPLKKVTTKRPRYNNTNINTNNNNINKYIQPTAKRPRYNNTRRNNNNNIKTPLFNNL